MGSWWILKEIIIIYIISLADCEHPLGTWASCPRREMFDLFCLIRKHFINKVKLKFHPLFL